MASDKIFEKAEFIINHSIDFDSATIWYSDEISSDFDTELRLKCQTIKRYYEAEKKPLREINLIVNSPGGDVYGIFGVVDLYEELEKEGILVNATATAHCMSAATFAVWNATGKRSSTKRCRFMVHEIQIEQPVGGTISQMRNNQVENDYLENELYKLYAEASLRNQNYTTKKFDDTVKAWKERCKKDFYFDADTALKFGVIDEII